MKTKHTFNLFGIILLCLFFCATFHNVQAQMSSGKLNELLVKLKRVDKIGTKVSRDLKEFPRYSFGVGGFLSHVAAPPLHYFSVAEIVPGNPEYTARNFLKENAELFGILSSKADFRIIKSRKGNGRTYVRFGQTYAGISIFGAEAIVQINSFNGVEYVLSDIAPQLKIVDKGKISITPTIAATEAGKLVKESVFGTRKGIKIISTPPQLKLFDPAVLDCEGDIRLVWEITVYSEKSTEVSKKILLDAHTGDIVREYPLNITALNREVHDSNNTTADPGTLSRSEGDPATGTVEVDSAYDFLGDTYDFYNDRHNRDSINDMGMTISVTVRYCEAPPEPCPYNNAFWCSWRKRMYFGDGYVTDDIVAHEYTHGVTQHESGLIYENHSGAINESFSDVWGEFVDLTNGAGTDTAAVRWEIGEDLWTMRDMSDPTLFGHPDRLNHPDFIEPVTNPDDTNDQGGVHTNNGVNNKLCYLLTDGDTFNNYAIDGMGINRVVALYYEVQTNLLSSGANYQDLYNALVQSAINLGWSNTERNNLYRACAAVEISNIYIDKSNWCVFPNGKMECFLGTGGPFTSVMDGVANANPFCILNIKSGTYDESQSVLFDRAMKLFPWEGDVTIVP